MGRSFRGLPHTQEVSIPELCSANAVTDLLQTCSPVTEGKLESTFVASSRAVVNRTSTEVVMWSLSGCTTDQRY
jgi:hypothetical protein